MQHWLVTTPDGAESVVKVPKGMTLADAGHAGHEAVRLPRAGRDHEAFDRRAGLWVLDAEHKARHERDRRRNTREWHDEKDREVAELKSEVAQLRALIAKGK